MNIEQIRELCLQLPHTSETIKYGDQLCFMVAGKSFCSANIKYLERVTFKLPDEDFEALCEKEGFSPAPYGGASAKWVRVADFDYLTAKEWGFYIRQSYELVKAKLTPKVLRNLENTTPSQSIN